MAVLPHVPAHAERHLRTRGELEQRRHVGGSLDGDALALALRLDCPIYVEESVLKTSKATSSVNDKVQSEELRKWLEGLNDEDLGRYKM